MSLAIVSSGKNIKYWVEAINRQDPSIEVQAYPHISQPENVIGALLWKHPHGSLDNLSNLKWITSLGAGVDHVLTDPNLPDVSITRIVDNNLAMDISRTAVMGVIGFEKQMPMYIRQKRIGIWKQHVPQRLKKVGILGLGEMGSRIARDLFMFGYEVYGFSRNQKNVENVTTFWGNKVPTEFLKDIDVLINVLPLTPETENILNHDIFRRMKKGSFLMNLGRGSHLVDNDLLESLEEEHLGGAFLDVFRIEPLPEEHPFWQEEKIVVTPHVASITDPESAVKLVLENYRRVVNGQPLLHVIEKNRGY
ncbi:MAG: glyoxylate/hydroxypyruvate reductase A [Cyclobacteriaceae bacterium]|nr:glyoxylate/hydroxypyruvate reductase A [Cyclobacteriaceae bacterium]